MKSCTVVLILLLSIVIPIIPIYPQKDMRQASNVIIEFIDSKYITNYSDSVMFRVRLYDNSTQEAISGQTVNFYLVSSDSRYLIGYSETNDKGEAHYSIDSVTYIPGRYEIRAEANVSGEVVWDQVEFIINKESTRISIIEGTSVEYTDSTEIKVKLFTDDGENIPDRPLNMSIYTQAGTPIDVGVSYTDANGLAVFNISTVGSYWDLKVKVYDCLIVFEGDDYYSPSSSKFSLNVTREKLNVYVSTIGKKIVGSSIIIFIRVEDNDGDVVAAAEITIFINEELVAIGRTDKDGTFEFSWIPGEPGNYTIKVLVSKSENYFPEECVVLLYIEGETTGNEFPIFLIAILLFLIIAVVVAFISRR